MIQMKGDFNVAEVVSGNSVQFNSYNKQYEYDDGNSHYNYSFSQATLNNYILTFRVNFEATVFFNGRGSVTISGYEIIELRKVKN